MVSIVKHETEMREIFTELSPENQESLLARAMQFRARQEKAGREGDFACGEHFTAVDPRQPSLALKPCRPA